MGMIGVTGMWGARRIDPARWQVKNRTGVEEEGQKRKNTGRKSKWVKGNHPHREKSPEEKKGRKERGEGRRSSR